MDSLGQDYSTPLLCTKCGQQGTATWEPERPDPVSASDQFYLRVKAHAKLPRLAVDIVCAKCGMVHRAQVPGPSPRTPPKHDLSGGI